jgi:16S rRNA (guanine527-N7)-methyltransferase
VTGDSRLRRWLEELLATPGLTAVADVDQAWRLHVEDALTALPLIQEGPVVDVGSGGGSPGIPLAASLPELQFVLLESSRRKAEFLGRVAREFPNVEVVWARAEDFGRREGRDAFATAVARALAPPPVAIEWCLPLVRSGGRLVLFTTEPDGRCAAVAKEIGAEVTNTIEVPGSGGKRLLVVQKHTSTPERYPRRPGLARKRPLS